MTFNGMTVGGGSDGVKVEVIAARACVPLQTSGHYPRRQPARVGARLASDCPAISRRAREPARYRRVQVACS
jgi:hypothetical protein